MGRHAVDLYGHRLVDSGDSRLELRINRKAKEFATLRGDNTNLARMLALRSEILSMSLSFFRVVGQGVSKGASFDEPLIDTLYWCLEHLDPAKRPYTHYVRYKYKLERLTQANAEKALIDDVDSLDEQELDGLNAAVIDDGYDAVDEEAQSFESDEDMLDGSAVHESMNKADAAIAEFLTLVIGFLDHAPDKSHTRNAQLYMRLNFTEWTTYAVKVLPALEYGEPFEREEGRIFATVEDGFLNVYMAEPCATVRQLWNTSLREGFGEIIPWDDLRMQSRRPPAPWKLSTRVHLDYLASLGVKVTPAVISQHRKRFNALKEQLTTYEA